MKRNYHTKLKHKVFKRDNYTCQLKLHTQCRGDMSKDYLRYKAKQITRTRLAISVDHLTPLSRGGKWHIDNLVTACTFCNLKKGNKTLDEIISAMPE